LLQGPDAKGMRYLKFLHEPSGPFGFFIFRI